MYHQRRSEEIVIGRNSSTVVVVRDFGRNTVLVVLCSSGIEADTSQFVERIDDTAGRPSVFLVASGHPDPGRGGGGVGAFWRFAHGEESLSKSRFLIGLFELPSLSQAGDDNVTFVLDIYCVRSENRSHQGRRRCRPFLRCSSGRQGVASLGRLLTYPTALVHVASQRLCAVAHYKATRWGAAGDIYVAVNKVDASFGGVYKPPNTAW